MHLEAPHPPARRWLSRARGALLASSVWLSTIGPTSAADTIISARFTEPTTRYAHGVLGDNIEYGTLEITVQTQRSKQTQVTDAAQDHSVLTIRLPEDRVFEDISPRLMDVDSDGKFEVVVVESQAQEGAQLAIYDASGQKIAATPILAHASAGLPRSARRIWTVMVILKSPISTARIWLRPCESGALKTGN